VISVSGTDFVPDLFLLQDDFHFLFWFFSLFLPCGQERGQKTREQSPGFSLIPMI
jgi:hypothetical protein